MLWGAADGREVLQGGADTGRPWGLRGGGPQPGRGVPSRWAGAPAEPMWCAEDREPAGPLTQHTVSLLTSFLWGLEWKREWKEIYLGFFFNMNHMVGVANTERFSTPHRHD